MRFRARRIELGHVTGAVEFDAPDSAAAWSTAHDGVDPLSGTWVDVRPVIEADPAFVPDVEPMLAAVEGE